MTGIFTISREDYYDYLRCPKIVALKTHKRFTTPPTPSKPGITRHTSYEIATIGEEATKEILSEPEEFESEEFEDDEESIISEQEFRPKPLEINLKEKGVQLDNTMKEVLNETLSGLKTIKKYLTDEYGKIKIIGKAESRNGIMPGNIRPDYVAISENLKKPLLIEIKNTKRINSKPDNFQASYYNSIAQKHGVLVLGQRQELGKNILSPTIFDNILAETLLVYPRLGAYQIVTENIKIDQKSVIAIWQSKQLGLKGKTPHTDCDSKCPHHRLGELPEDNIQPAIPLPLTIAKGLAEQKFDFDTDFIVKHYSKLGLTWELRKNMWDFDPRRNPAYFVKDEFPEEFKKNEKILKEKKKKYLEMFSQKTGIGKNTLNQILERNRDREKERKVFKEMNNEIHPWQKILGKKKLEKILPLAKGQAHRTYSIPEKSSKFVNQSWKEWI